MDRHEDDPLMIAWEHRPRRNIGLSYKSIEASNDRLSAIEKEIFITRLKTAYSPKKKPKYLFAREKPPYEGYVASRLVVDFGTIMIGENKKIEKEIMSITPLPISFEIVTDALEGTGFSISPTSFQDIPPQSKITLTFSFETERRVEPIIGPLEIPVYLIFSESLCYMIHIFANLAEPALSLSKSNFEFESTIVGQSRTMVLQIQNINKIPTEFTIKDPAPINMLQRKKKNIGKGVFKVDCNTGVLAPLSFKNITITFTPKAEKIYTMQLPIETKHNDDTTFVTLKGQGYMLKLEFDPPVLNFSPKLPYTDTEYMKFRMINPTNHTIEVYSTQFDNELYRMQNSQEMNSEENTLIVSTTQATMTTTAMTTSSSKVLTQSIPKEVVDTLCKTT